MTIQLKATMVHFAVLYKMVLLVVIWGSDWCSFSDGSLLAVLSRGIFLFYSILQNKKILNVFNFALGYWQ